MQIGKICEFIEPSKWENMTNFPPRVTENSFISLCSHWQKLKDSRNHRPMFAFTNVYVRDFPGSLSLMSINKVGTYAEWERREGGGDREKWILSWNPSVFPSSRLRRRYPWGTSDPRVCGAKSRGCLTRKRATSFIRFCSHPKTTRRASKYKKCNARIARSVSN